MEVPPSRVERLMTLSEAEFIRSIAALLPPGSAVENGCAVATLGSGRVTITYEPLTSLRLGQSLQLPRARIVLAFEEAVAAEREAFLARFDLAFQRGGG